MLVSGGRCDCSVPTGGFLCKEIRIGAALWKFVAVLWCSIPDRKVPRLLIGTVPLLCGAPRVPRSVNKSTTFAIVVVVVALAVRPAEAETIVVLVGAVPVIATIVTARVLAWLATGSSPFGISSLGLSALSAAAILVEINLTILKVLLSLLTLQL